MLQEHQHCHKNAHFHLCAYGVRVMDIGSLCFISEDYFVRYNDKFLLRNHPGKAQKGKRPYLVVAQDKYDAQIYWAVPLSSKYAKYKYIHDQHVMNSRSKRCNTIMFAMLNGRNNAFLIQNMCPITKEDVVAIWQKGNNTKVGIHKKDLKKITHAVKDVLRKYFNGVNLIYPNAKRIYADKVTEHNLSKILPVLAMNSTLLTCAHIKRTGNEIKSTYFVLREAPLSELKIMQVVKQHGMPRVCSETKISDPTFEQAFNELVETDWDEHITIYSSYRDNTPCKNATHTHSEHNNHRSDLDR